MGESLRRLCARALECNTQRVALRSLARERGAGYNSIPITLVGTVLRCLFLAGEWELLGFVGGLDTANDGGWDIKGRFALFRSDETGRELVGSKVLWRGLIGGSMCLWVDVGWLYDWEPVLRDL